MGLAAAADRPSMADCNAITHRAYESQAVAKKTADGNINTAQFQLHVGQKMSSCQDARRPRRHCVMTGESGVELG